MNPHSNSFAGSGPILVIGSSNVDFVMQMERLPTTGETVTDATFLQTFGGKGANAAVGAARAGGQVRFVNCVGDDAFGAQIIAQMQAMGVDTSAMITVPGSASGSALVMIDANGANYLSVAPGTNYALLPTHIDQLSDQIAQAALIVLQYEILPATLYAIIERAAALQRPVLFNYAPARPLEQRYLAKISLLVVNEIEAAALSAQPINSVEQAHAVALALRCHGPQIVVITLGARGVVVAHAEGSFALSAHQVPVVDTTAAGDVFCGALSVALVEGRDLQASIQFANAAAALAVTKLGAQPSAPTRADIDHLLQHGIPLPVAVCPASP